MLKNIKQENEAAPSENAARLRRIITPYLNLDQQKLLTDDYYLRLACFIDDLQKKKPYVKYFPKCDTRLPFSLTQFADGKIYINLKRKGCLCSRGASKKMGVALCVKTGQPMAQLTLQPRSLRACERIKDEYDLGRKIQNGNAPGLLGFESGLTYEGSRRKNYPFAKVSIYQDLAPEGDLHQFLEKIQSSLTTQVKLKIACDILQGLIFLHETLKIAHLDLKLGNILIKRINFFNLEARLMDFGHSHQLNKKLPRELRGTIAYCAPEFLCKHFFCYVPDPYIHSIDLCRMDMYSLGVTLYALCYGVFPSASYFSEAYSTLGSKYHSFFDLHYIKKCYLDCYHEIKDEIEIDIIKNIRDRRYCHLLNLILHLLNPSPNGRPSAQRSLSYLKPSFPSATSEQPAGPKISRLLKKWSL